MPGDFEAPLGLRGIKPREWGDRSSRVGGTNFCTSEGKLAGNFEGS
jgi:hypothetical protein